MAIFEMPLEKLKEYKGVNPKPSDFDEYWERALSELSKCSLDYELIPAKDAPRVPYAECFDMFFTGVQGAKIHCRVVKPKDKSKKGGAIGTSHGYAYRSDDWSLFFGFAAAGHTVISLDCRGQGGLSEDVTKTNFNTYQGHVVRGVMDENPDNLLYRQIYLDAVQMMKIAKTFPEVDGSRLGYTGGSNAGGIGVALAALMPEIKKIGVVFPFLSDFQRYYNMDLCKPTDVFSEISYYFRTCDPLHEREEEFFTKLGYIDTQHMAHKIKADVLWVCGLMDVSVPASTQFATYNKIKSNKNMLLYKDYGHLPFIPKHKDRIFDFLMDL